MTEASKPVDIDGVLSYILRTKGDDILGLITQHKDSLILRDKTYIVIDGKAFTITNVGAPIGFKVLPEKLGIYKPGEKNTAKLIGEILNATHDPSGHLIEKPIRGNDK